jgi:sterol desaturase/sphingolipid hydroxylase (fatty acid hydroxylase superfamily)
MLAWLLGHSAEAYTAAIVGGFVVVAAWETVRPLRPTTVPLAPRWTINLVLLGLNHALVYWLLPFVAIGAAWHAQSQGWGLLQALDLSPIAATVAAFLALDLLRWGMHAAMHRLPVLWRLHRVHHSDLDYDCTIGLRFHPFEGVLTQAVVIAAILALGVSPVAVLLSDLATIALGYVVHGNVGLPPSCDRVLRLVLVTPDVHRVHHSVRVDESQSNFGSVLTWWDRLFGSYRAAPADGQVGMTIGLADLRDPRKLTLPRVLWLPFERPPTVR